MNGVYNTGSSNFSNLFSRPTQFSFQRPVQQNTFSFQQPAQQSFNFGQNASSPAPTNSLTSLLNALTGSLGSIFGGSATPATPATQNTSPFVATSVPSNNGTNILNNLFASLFGGSNNLFGGGSANNFGSNSVAPQIQTNSFYNSAPAQNGYNGVGVIPSYNNYAVAPQQQGQPAYQSINFAQTNGGQIRSTGQVAGGMAMSMEGGDEGVGPGRGHDFLSHVRSMYPTTIAPGQSQYGGFTQINGNTFVGRSVITGMQPVIEQAIYDIVRVPGNRNLEMSQIESKVAQRLTQLNDFSQLRAQTRDRLEDITGVNFGSWSKAEREESINHLLHSPLPFGNIQQVMSPNQRIDLGYTHTLDKDRTQVKDLGNGIFQIKMISNNNNGSHTGHNLGVFRVQLAPGMTLGEAKDFGNRMIVNTNDNTKLYLSEVARTQLMDALADY